MDVPNISDVAVGKPEGPPVLTDHHPEVSLLRLAYLNKPEVPILLLGTIAAVAAGAVYPVYGSILSSAIASFYKPPAELKKGTIFWALMFVVLGMASFLATLAEIYLFSVARSELIRRIRSMCFEKVVQMEVGWFDEAAHSSGAMGARLSTDAASVRVLVGDSLALIVQNIATALAGLLIAFIASWQLSLIILVLLPLIGVSGYAEIKFMRGFSADAKVRYNTEHFFFYFCRKMFYLV